MTTLDLSTLTPTDISHLQLDHLDLANIPGVPSENILTPSRGYKPFRYEWAYEVFLVQNRVHWLPDEVPLADDVKDWNTKLTPQEHHLVRQTFRLFTQSDTDLNESYGYNYLKRFVASELLSANSAIGNIESIHRAAYSHLLDTLGLPEEEYVKFYDFPEMLAKHNYMTSFRMDTIHNTAVTLAGLGAFTEGVQLYASFAILLNFTRHNKLKGMGQVVAWSQRDESLHADYNVLLFKTLTTEFAAVLDADKLREDILTVCHQVIANEDRYIDLVFELGPVEGMTADSLKEYIRNIMDERMAQLGYEKPFGCANPFPWITDLLSGVEHTNFFENRSTNYAKAASRGTWDEVFSELIK